MKLSELFYSWKDFDTKFLVDGQKWKFIARDMANTVIKSKKERLEAWAGKRFDQEDDNDSSEGS